MSLDNFIECKSCGKNMAAAVWMKLYGSIDHADLSSAPDFLSAFIPDPVVLKIVFCLGCQTMKPCTDYTPEEEAALAKRNEKQIKKVELGKKFEGLMGGKKAAE